MVVEWWLGRGVASGIWGEVEGRSRAGRLAGRRFRTLSRHVFFNFHLHYIMRDKPCLTADTRAKKLTLLRQQHCGGRVVDGKAGIGGRSWPALS